MRPMPTPSRARRLLLPALAAAALAAAAPAAFANTDHGSHAGHGSMQAAPAATLADGIVKKLDQAAGRIVIAHGPLPNGMPAMTMPFALKDTAWFGKLKEGQKIRFSIEDVKGVLTVQHLEAVK